jgi:hypothetical protein
MNDTEIDNAISQFSVTRPENLKVTLMTEEERAKMAVLDDKRYYKKKYKLALQFGAKMQLHEFHRTNPTWGAKDVLVEILKNYNSDFPSLIVLEMAQYIVEEWETIQNPKKELALT